MDDLSLAIQGAIKLAGSFLGAILAFIVQPPKTQADFVTRGAFSVITGLAFNTPVREYLKWPETVEYTFASIVLTAMLSWFVMGAVLRILGSWKPK